MHLSEFSDLEGFFLGGGGGNCVESGDGGDIMI